ncbi:MAG TPA: FAD-dependent oxidoreductase [Chitinolyticbacter sp.]|nr:FAD-dependent oxidoreductase [Chitinolyticbacter sp.]
MDRRGFLAASGLMLVGCSRLARHGTPIELYAPGLAAGHALRGHPAPPTPSATLQVDTVIAGSGVAGLSAGWQLARAGFKDFLVLSGPELYGNAAAGEASGLVYPRGAHYLPLPSSESGHIRELLYDAGLLDGMRYDEAALVHAPQERLWIGGRWQEGLMPEHGVAPHERAEQARFLAHMHQLAHTRGNDDRRVFALPIAAASSDPAWRALDRISFAQWLDREGYHAPSLRWYLDYCCQDDYGIALADTSAWAGLHYFASRNGQASNADEHAVLTWPDGLNPLARHMATRIGQDRLRAGHALRIDTGAQGAVVLAQLGKRTVEIRARRVICAMPLHVAAHVVTDLAALGYDAARHRQHHAPWLVANVLLDRFPTEAAGAPLSWDNVVYRGRSLGYVVSSHQLIRAARPERTVFTAYQALPGMAAAASRRHMLAQDAETLFADIAADLDTVYDWRWARHASHVELTLRGHAMTSPTPGFLDNAGLAALRQLDGPLLFAHSDLSGFSVFEEAAWWGLQAAHKILG